ncbi:hypothetical protein A4X13_0g7910, partial [Tilletia indica]
MHSNNRFMRSRQSSVDDPLFSDTSSYGDAPSTAPTSMLASPMLTGSDGSDIFDEELRIEVDSQRIARLLALASSVTSGAAAEDQSYGLLHQLFEAQVSLTPKKICLQQGTERFVTYQQLNQLAERGATGLRALGISPGSLIPICYAKSVDMIVAILSILKSGGAYVPVAPNHPRARKQAILEQVRPRIALSKAEDATSLEFEGSRNVDISELTKEHEVTSTHNSKERCDLSQADATQENDPNEITTNDLAYVIFTSGTTGTPKGVMIEHRNVYAYVSNHQGSAKSTQYSRRLSFASFIFDASIGDFFGTLTSGGCLVLDNSESLIANLTTALDEYNISHICLTPSVAAFASKGLNNVSWLHALFLGGEACGTDLVANLPELEVHYNVYGPSEAAVEVTEYNNTLKPPYKAQSMPIGRPIGQSQLYILQQGGFALMSCGAVGEICIGGPQVGRGYLNDEEKTKSKFVSDPFVEGGRMFRTGDLGRIYDDGLFECLGRIDGQVKIRGLRIETGEVEAAIVADKAVEAAKVVKMKLADDMDRLVGFVVLLPNEQEIDDKDLLKPLTLDNELANQIWETMENKLPSYMLPFLLVQLGALPITQNGKLDERRLRSTISELTWSEQAAFTQTAATGEDDAVKAEPQNETQAKLRSLWAQVLQLDETAIGIDDSFYRVGGDSITAVRLLILCREAGFDVRISDLNNTSTIRSQADRGAEVRHNLLAKKDQEVSDWLDEHSLNRLMSTVLPSVGLDWEEVEDVAPASPLQRGLIAETMQSTDGSAYVTWRITRFQHSIDAERLRDAVVQVVKETPIYRTRFALDSLLGVVQIVADKSHAEALVSPVVSVPAEADIGFAAEQVAHSHTWGHPQTSPLHISILASSSEVRMVWIAHHALTDGWSVTEMQKRLRVLYTQALQGPTAIQAKSSPPFARVAHHLHQRDTQEDLAFWQAYMSGAEALQLGSRNSAGLEVRQKSTATASVITGLETCARNVGVPPSTIFLYALAVGLRLLTDQEDVSFGLLLSGRTLPVSGIESIIGPCINTTICRIMFNDQQSVRQALQQFQANLDEVNERGYVGLVDIAGAARVDSAAIAGTLAEYRNLPEEADAVRGDTSQAHPFDDMDIYGEDRVSAPLMVSGGPDHTGALRVSITADKCFLSEVDARWLVRHVCNVLSWVCDTEGEERLKTMDVVDDAQFDAIMEWSVAPEADNLPEDIAGPELLHQLIEAQVERTPRKIAIQCEGDEFLTFEQLNQRAERVAASLRALGVGAGSIVPMCFFKSSAMLVGLFGILKSGAAYVPLDPAHPQARKDGIVKAVAAEVVLMSDECTESWTPPAPAKPILFSAAMEGIEAVGGEIGSYERREVCPTDLAYLIFTSGSTGTPKGVMLEHAQVVAYLTAQFGIPHEPAFGRQMNFASIAFDGSVPDLLGSLATGTCVVLVRTDRLLADLAGQLDAKLATGVCLTSSVAAHLRPHAADPQLHWLQSLILAGEGVKPDLCQELKSLATIWNAYGPTEAAVEVANLGDSATAILDGGALASVPIGTPRGRNRLYVLEPGSEKVLPVGAIGELCIGGPQVARGYLNDEEKTRAKFVSDPFVEGGRMFRTGDLGRLHGDGLFECLGRIDGQVKIRGLRIETGEIEATISTDKQIRQASVLKMKLADEVDRLVGFVVLHGD